MVEASPIDSSFSQDTLIAPTSSRYGPEALSHTARGILFCLISLKEVAQPQEQVFELYAQAKLLEEVSNDLEEEGARQRRGQRSLTTLSVADQFHLTQLSNSVEVVVERCLVDTANPLESQLSKITTLSSTDFSLRKESKLPNEDLLWYEHTCRTLKDQTDTLQVLRTATNLAYCKTEVNLQGDLSATARDGASTLQSLLPVLKLRLESTSSRHDVAYLHSAIQRAEAFAQTLPSMSINQHFRIPTPANSVYTGRQKELQDVERAFNGTLPGQQKRFVVQGAPGAGKTELALKYAESSVATYWGVFWVDASSRANATQSYAEIAKIGGVEPNEQSAKHWLSGRYYPWLLIIDNADDDKIRLEELFPLGSKGCVLITTRNPTHLTYGTAGKKFVELGDMESDEAKDLLLRAAAEPTPWTTAVVEQARNICKHLHYLPLALHQAGKAIVNGLANIFNYIRVFEGEAARIRRARAHRRDRSSSRERARKRGDQDERSMSAFASYEILYQSLEGASKNDEIFADALQLLQIFSYMHFQNIRLDFFIHATVIPLKEKAEMKTSQRQADALTKKLGIKVRRSWDMWLRDTIGSVSTRFLSLPPVLPEALKNPDDLEAGVIQDEVEARLRQALKVLVERSLVFKLTHTRDHHHGTDRFRMHALVHKWVRERPQLLVAQEALLCQCATTILSRAIRLFGKDSDHEMSMRLEMKPHIDHVRQCAAVVQERLNDNQRRNKSMWSTLRFIGPQADIGPLQANEYARFGKLYLESGAFDDAENLFRMVRTYLVGRLGNDHDITQRVKLGLAAVFGYLSRMNEATDLLREVFESRRKTLGMKHPLTIEIMGQLAGSVLSQGRITESLHLCEGAKAGLEQAYGEKDVRVYRCIDQIGKCHQYYFNFETAAEYHLEALVGMENLGGDDAPMEVDILNCQENLVTAQIRMGITQTDSEEAERMMRHVVKRRTGLLGKDSPYTLMGIANLGRTLASRGKVDEAELLMSQALEVAVRNLKEDHMGVMVGRIWYAQVLMQKGELSRAETLLRPSTPKEKYAKAAAKDGEHPDRIIAVWNLVDCLERQGVHEKLEEALRLCKELEYNIPRVGGHGLGAKHKFNDMLAKRMAGLEHKIIDRESQVQAAPGIPQPEAPVATLRHPSQRIYRENTRRGSNDDSI